MQSTCDECGRDGFDPLDMRPVYVVVADHTENLVLSDKPLFVCEDCWPEASEPERQWRLAQECPTCWTKHSDGVCPVGPATLPERPA